MKTHIPFAQYRAKFAGIFMILLQIGFQVRWFINYNEFHRISSGYFGVCFGLFFIFFSKEKVEKEEYTTLRFYALTLALIFSFVLLPFISSYITFIEKERQYMSAYEFVILVLSSAIGIFYYLKAKSKKKIEAEKV